MQGFSCENIFGWYPFPDSFKTAGMRPWILLWCLLVHLGLHISFAKSGFHLTLHFLFLGLCWETVDVSVINCLSYSSWLILCSRGNLLQSMRFFTFCAKPPSAWNIECLPFCSSFIFLFLPFSFSAVSVSEVVSIVVESAFLEISSSWCRYCYRCHT